MRCETCQQYIWRHNIVQHIFLRIYYCETLFHSDTMELMMTLLAILNPANRPLLIHCNKGKHRTGSLVGCLRKIRGWSLSSIFSEYLIYALPKARLEDQICIESFNVLAFKQFAHRCNVSLPEKISRPISIDVKQAAQNDTEKWCTLFK